VAENEQPGPVAPAAIIHGGAGAVGAELREHPDEYRAALLTALESAQRVLESGRSALVAARTAVQIMEDWELFNAGYGSVLCADGTVEMSAALMRGSDRQAGAVAGVRVTKNPIIAALTVFESHEVLLAGEAADRYAIAHGAQQRPNASFVTERQRRRLAARLGTDEHGTVGAVCLDTHGVLAAATSTGGVMGQPPGRVGDSPLIGAGTWADARVAISCTGDGEAFIRAGVARSIASLVEGGVSLEAAVGRALGDVSEAGGTGGLIALAADGAAVMPFTTEMMHRGIWRAGEEPAADSLAHPHQ
jgi:L-asparaginase / beta-aspartyl-peptidase